MHLIIFPEGTRYSPEKSKTIADSQEYAEKEGKVNFFLFVFSNYNFVLKHHVNKYKLGKLEIKIEMKIKTDIESCVSSAEFQIYISLCFYKIVKHVRDDILNSLSVILKIHFQQRKTILY